MALVNFTAVVASIDGKIAGSVFQRSNGGNQVRTKVSPRNPRTLRQQQGRQAIAWLSAQFGQLSSADQNTWIAVAGNYVAGMQLYIARNSLLSRCGLSMINAYVAPSADPGISIQALYFSWPDGLSMYVLNNPGVPPGWQAIGRFSPWIPTTQNWPSQRDLLAPNSSFFDPGGAKYQVYADPGNIFGSNFPSYVNPPANDGYKRLGAFSIVEIASGFEYVYPYYLQLSAGSIETSPYVF